jgi:putative transposase
MPATPDTLLRWYERLLAQKCDGSKPRRPLGRPRVSEAVEPLVVHRAEENPTWGYRRLQEALTNLGHHIGKVTVRNILRCHPMAPAPQRRQAGMRWAQLLTRHWEVLPATDFLAVEAATYHGLVTYSVLLVMELATRRVRIAGITPHPAAVMQPCARQLTDSFDGFLLGKRYVLHDRDTKFTRAFDALRKGSGVEPIVLPARSPNLNAHGERLVRSIEEKTLDQLRLLSERSLSSVIHQYVAHSHAERNHQGLANQRMAPEPDLGSQSGQVRRRERLGGLLHDYYRDAA